MTKPTVDCKVEQGIKDAYSAAASVAAKASEGSRLLREAAEDADRLVCAAYLVEEAVKIVFDIRYLGLLKPEVAAEYRDRIDAFFWDVQRLAEPPEES